MALAFEIDILASRSTRIISGRLKTRYRITPRTLSREGLQGSQFMVVSAQKYMKPRKLSDQPMLSNYRAHAKS